MSNKIIVAPLNWGLGHATRCIPIIKALVEGQFTPVIASDGSALKLLQKEFPGLESLELPSYNIKYKRNLKWGLISQLPKILKSIKIEEQIIAKYVKENEVVGIISDNRFGVRNSEIPSVYITHQLNVLSGITTFISTSIHRRIVKKFDQCWIPDTSIGPKLSGKLSKVKGKHQGLKFVGALSRFEKLQIKKKYDVLILLSGPEPHRTLFEEKLLSQLTIFNRKVLFVRGLISKISSPVIKDNLTIVNFMLTNELQEAINQSEVVLARSGYSTILDLAKLEKKAFFVPTPGQFEQEYLAGRMKKLNIGPYAKQKHFELKMLERVKLYDGFVKTGSPDFDSTLFEFFKSK